MNKYNISANLLPDIKHLYDVQSSSVAALKTGSIQQLESDSRLSPTPFNIFLEWIMADILEDHNGTISIGGKTITNLRFADELNDLAAEEEELAKPVEHFDKASTACGIELRAKYTKLMTNNTRGINKETKVNAQKLQVPGLH